jgi:uncharacterized repeat protein (TIGR03803 family)
MKTSCIIILLLAVGAIALQAQTATTVTDQDNPPAATDYKIIQQDGNSRVWRREIYSQMSNGEVITNIQKYTELATGLNYQNDNGQWLASQEEIDLQPDGSAAAIQGQHQAYFPSDIYNGQIELVTPNGVHLKSQPAALSYDDGSHTVLIAVLTNSIGQIINKNEVIYTNAFSGVDADLVYLYTRSGLEQDIVLREQPPTPTTLGLNAETTRLQAITEFLNPPQPDKTTSTLPEQAGLALNDDALDFGMMEMVNGKAFMIGESSPPARVGKSWVKLEGRQLLVESVPFAALANELEALPQPLAQTTSTVKGRMASRKLVLPPQHLAKANGRGLKLTKAIVKQKPGVVLDYITVNSSITNTTFRGDSTYYISGMTYSYGTNLFEGGAVIKYATNGEIYVAPHSGTTPNVTFKTSAYRPVIFTAKDDNSVGSTISGSTGSPLGYYGTMLDGYVVGNGPTLSDFRMSYAGTGITWFGANVNLSDAQFVNCQSGVNLYLLTTWLENVLFANTQTNIVSSGFATVNALNSTFSGGACLFGGGASSYDDVVLDITNCILSSESELTNGYVTVNGNNNGLYNSPFFGGFRYTIYYPFQTAGGGSYYLTNGSPFHNVGLSSIGSTLLADLAAKTTYPPSIYTNVVISTNLVLGPFVPRDTNAAPDLGYHYSAIDYLMSGVAVNTGGTITANPGTAIGMAGTPRSGMGVFFGSSGNPQFICNGTATKPDQIAEYNTVQESSPAPWQEGGCVYSEGGSSTINCRFTQFSVMADDVDPVFIGFADQTGDFYNCEFHGGTVGVISSGTSFINCLFERVETTLEDGSAYPITFRNNLFWNDSSMFFLLNDSASLVQDNVFYGSSITDDSGSSYIGGYNGYYGTGSTYLLRTNSTDKFLTSDIGYEASFFGKYYIPTNSPLINAGSTNANQLGLYHFTVTTNQVVDGTNIVSIGYHYVATDANGNPLDSNGDGIPDYLEDPLGDGLPYDGTNWALAILVQPTNQTVVQGSNVTLNVTAGGVPALSYQWYWDGTALSDEGNVFGSGSETLVLNAVQPDQSGSYYVVVHNGFGSVTSTPAIITVAPSQTYDTFPLYIMPPYDYWNVTDISDPGQPANIGELQEPFSEPSYVPGVSSAIPPLNTPWHTNTTTMFTEAYGTTAFGGSGYGTVFRIDPAGPLQGTQPNELVLSGNTLYGTTAGLGGTAFGGYGTIFSINTSGLDFTNVYSFNPSGTPASGTQPEAGLVLSEGMLYGTTESGGDGFGTVFVFNSTNGNFNNLYTFTGPDSNDGSDPSAKLLLCGNTLYGTTSSGGTHNKGTIFQINVDGSGYQIIHDFAGQAEGDGESPEAALILSGGILYGTTESGGAYGLGTVFSFNTNNNVYTVLHGFKGNQNDGGNPQGGLVVLGSTLYGATAGGGTNFCGTVFSITTGGSFTILHSFNESNISDGSTPYAGLVLSGATLYGTTAYGGSNDFGTAFSISTSGSGYTNLYSFRDGADGAYPATALVLSNNILFGTTPGDSSSVGDPNGGTIFSINTNGSGFTVLSTFSTFRVIHAFSGLDGAYPCAQLAISGSTFYGIPTTVYGTTSDGGTNNCGTVFKVNTDGTGFTNLYEFTGTNDGKYPQTGLLIDGNILYGTTTNSIFKISTDGSDFTCLTNINGASQLVLWISGHKLFGTTTGGSGTNYGSVFSINTDGSGFTNIYNFPGGAGGEFPKSGLELYGVGSFIDNGPTATCTVYGTTYSGGASNYGMIFSINTDGSDFTDIHDFNGTSDGAYPMGGLFITNNNTGGNSATYLFGTTSSGGTNGSGTVFGMSLGGGANTPVQTLYSFGGVPGSGAYPEGKLALLSGLLCGTTAGGGAYTNGTVFIINPNGSGFTDIYDFNGGNNGGSPLAGLTLPVVDNKASIWSADTTINVSAENVTNLAYSIAMDNYDALFVNGNLLNWTNHSGAAEWSPYLPLTYLHQGINDIRVIIGGDDDAADYFAMAIKSTAAGVVLSNNVFGTTFAGGDGNGTVFEITSAGSETNLYSFSGQPDGANPIGNLVLSSNTLYGVTESGGSNGVGAIFSLNIGSTNDEILYRFGTINNDGQTPKAGLLLVGNTLFGTTYSGGTGSGGTIFKINKDGSGYADLRSFAGGNDGAQPQAGLLLISNMLYGTTYSGGIDGAGTIFSISTNGSNYHVLYNFSGINDDGQNPMAGLIFSSNTLYGTTYYGGSNSVGTVFSFAIGGTNDTILYNFTNTPDGANPQAGLLLISNILYGTTYGGGFHNGGTIFSVGINGNGYNVLQDFGSFYGGNPEAGLIIQGNSLYGTTSGGGAYGEGNVFGISTNGAGFNDIYDFLNNPDGASPEGGLCSP